MFDILTYIPGRKKLTSSGWYSFNAICCSNFGHRQDRKGRGGVHYDGDNWSYHCFNCGFKTSFVNGRTLSPKTRNLLKWCGVDELEIQRLNLLSLKNKDALSFISQKKEKVRLSFDEAKLPNGELLDKNNIRHKRYIDYLIGRKIDVDSYPFMITPNEQGRMAKRIIIPYTYKNKIVGHTSRFLDNRMPKYINEQQPGYVFNFDIQKTDWQICIVVEGIFDALSIDGVAVMHDDISDKQSQLINSLHKSVIVVPDRDSTGLKICDRALELGYNVSLPKWDIGVKDVNDAVVKYGKLPTLLSIIESATKSKIKIELRKNQIAKGL
jgi:hypothetical protein